jgi:hypothetical protein
VLTLIASGTCTILEAVWGPFATGELTLLSKLVGLGALRPGMLLSDRYFSGHPQIAQIIAVGADRYEITWLYFRGGLVIGDRSGLLGLRG